MGDTFQLRVKRQSAYVACAVSTTISVGQFFQDKLKNGEMKTYTLPSQPMEITLFYKVTLGKDIVEKIRIDPRGYELVEVVFYYKMTAATFVPFMMFFKPTAHIVANANYFRNMATSRAEAQTEQQAQAATLPKQPIPQVNQTAANTSATVKFCPYCGFRLPADAKFCSRCGKQQPGI